MSRDKDIETAETVTMDGNAFRAMVAALRESAGDMLHRHVMVVQAAIDTARAGEPKPEIVETVQAG
jgi:predicted ATPase